MSKLIIWIGSLFLCIALLIYPPLSKILPQWITQEVLRIDYYVLIVILAGLGIGIVVCLSKGKIDEIKRLNIIEERNRIALDLHDGTAQDMANIIKRLELCERLFVTNPAQGFEELKVLEQDTRLILDKTRQTIFDLKLPYDADFNLEDKLNTYIEKYQKQNNIKVKLDTFSSTGDIPANKLKQIFYIIMEALTNIAKHSSAKNVELSIQSSDNNKLRLNIRDDGTGFDDSEEKSSGLDYSGLGIAGMRQRANSLGGRFAITSTPGKGTEISVTIPLKERTV